MFSISSSVLSKYPGFHAGILTLRGVENPSAHQTLEDQKRALEEDLRKRFEGRTTQELEATPPLPAYAAYYRLFDKTYHVSGQLKSVALMAKPIPSVAALVEAMYMAELKNGLLTAGHDLDQIHSPVTLNIATGKESYQLMRGSEQVVKADDLYIADSLGILSSILYGPNQRSRITGNTHNVFFTVYAPAGVTPENVDAHLRDIACFVRLVSPSSVIEEMQVVG